MRTFLTLIAGAALLGAIPAAARPGESGEAELARVLSGRVAGPAVHCLDLHRVSSSRIIPHTAIVYDAGGTLYVNRPVNGAEQLSHFDTMVTRTPSTTLCNVDVVQLHDQGSHSFTGTVFLGDFVPYTRVRTSSSD
jgi:hypothetical protein